MLRECFEQFLAFSTYLPFCCSVGFFAIAYAPRALAADNTANPSASYTIAKQGSTPTHRSQVDTSPGNVYIYVGGSFAVGTFPLAFQYLFDFTQEGNTSGYITPLLFERKSAEAYTIYTVVGIGKSFKVEINSLPRTIPFDVVEGTKVAVGGDITFGFINAIVNSSGAQLAASPGAVDMDNLADSGEGVGGTGTTNDWAVTNISPYPLVAPGTTFGASGSGADYPFWGSYRTYSAQVLGIPTK